MVSRIEWAEEALRRGASHVREAGPGCRNDTLFKVTARMADYLRDGTLQEAVVEATLLEAIAATELPGREARRTLRSAMERGDAARAWYPTDTAGLIRRSPRVWWSQRVQEAWADAGLPTTAYDDSSEGERVRVVIYASLTGTMQGTVHWWTWDEMDGAVRGPLDCTEEDDEDLETRKRALPLWSFAELEDDNRGRRKDGVDRYGRKQTREPHCHSMHALMLDYDADPEWSLEQVRTWWGAVSYVAHTTSQHSATHPRGRVALALSRPLTPVEYERVAEWVLVSGRGRMGVSEARTIARAYFVPAKMDEHYEAEANLAGQAIDVDVLLGELETLEDEHAADATTPNDDVESMLLRGPAKKDQDGVPIPHSGEPRRLLKNVRTCIEEDPRRSGLYQLCEFRQKVLEAGEPITDVHLTRAQYWLADTYGLHASLDHTQQVITEQAQKHHIHPVRRYLRSLQWDGVERIDTWLTDYLGVRPSPLHDAYAAKWLVSAVARILTPGCQVDCVLVLKGPQGCGKSSSLRALASEAWFCDASIDFRSQDAPRSLAGVWIYELAELDALARSEATAAKAFLTTRVDHYRVPYGRVHVDVPRQTVFAASTNDATFLRDDTGSRRFWVVEVGEADIAGVATIRDQLWAEAHARYLAGKPWYLSQDLEVERERLQEAYRMRDPWEETIVLYIERNKLVWITAREVLREVVHMDSSKATKAHEMRIANVLRGHGWERQRRQIGGERTWGFAPMGV